MNNNEPQAPAVNEGALPEASAVKTLPDVAGIEAQTSLADKNLLAPVTIPEAAEMISLPLLPPAPETAMVLYQALQAEPQAVEEAAPPTKKEQGTTAEAPPRSRRPARLETFLTAVVLIAAAIGITWGLARPSTFLFPPTQEQTAQLGQSPDCRRVRFDVAHLLGERWRQTISSCLRGSCENLRESLIARNFPIATWQLLEEDDSGQGCEVNAQGPEKSAECTRLLGRVEGVAKTVLLQVEGECREKL
jgi:hypothetical protein